MGRIREIVFVIGMPGAGKSTAAKYLASWITKTSQIPTLRWDDFSIILELFQKEKQTKLQRFSIEDDGNFKITCSSVLSEALQILSQKIETEPKKNLIIEFSRLDYDTAFQKQFKNQLKKSHLVEVIAFPEQFQNRNQQRSILNLDAVEDHQVPESIMQEYKNALLNGSKSYRNLPFRSATCIPNDGNVSDFTKMLSRLDFL